MGRDNCISVKGERGWWSGLRPPAAVLVALVFVSVSTEDCLVSFDDLPSKTIRSKAIFSGNVSAPQPLRPLLLPDSPRGVQVVEFQVDEGGDVLKTDPSLPLPIAENNGQIFVAWDLGICAGRVSLVHGHKYIVFLNGSSTQREEEKDKEEGEARTVYWSAGSPVQFNADSKNTINKFKRQNYGNNDVIIIIIYIITYFSRFCNRRLSSVNSQNGFQLDFISLVSVFPSA